MIEHNGGMHTLYDLDDYAGEKPQGFGLWIARLRASLQLGRD